MITERIRYDCVVDALIARFDSEVSVEKHASTKTILNHLERDLYDELSIRMASYELDVRITTKDTRKNIAKRGFEIRIK